MILVTGGTGFIGSRIVSELLLRYEDSPVRILSRRVQTSNPWGRRVEFVQGNVLSPATLSPALDNVQVVIHSVQFPNHPVEVPSKGWTCLEVDVRGTRNLVGASQRAGVRRIVHLSCAAQTSCGRQSWIEAKNLAEQAVRESGIPYVILRSSLVYGPGDRLIDRIVPFVRYSPLIPIPGDGSVKSRPVSVSDVARAASLSTFTPDAVGRILELGGPQEFSMNEIVSAVQKVIGKRRLRAHIPPPLARVLAGFLYMLPNPTLSPSAIDWMLAPRLVDSRLAEQILDIQFEDLETALRRYLR